MNFVRGMRAKLPELPDDKHVTLGVHIRSKGGAAVDVCCFGLDPEGRLSDDRYFVFYNQAESPCGSMALAQVPPGETQVFRVALGRLPVSVRHLVITCSIDGEGAMSELQPGYLRITGAVGEVARFPFQGSDFALEKSIILAELYERDGTWRLWAVGQGFAGGLGALLEHYGGSAADSASPPPVPDPPSVPPVAALPSVPVAHAPPPPAPPARAPAPVPAPPPSPPAREAEPPPPPPRDSVPRPTAPANPPAPAVAPTALPVPGVGSFRLPRRHRPGSIRVLLDGEPIPASALRANDDGATGADYSVDHERVCARVLIRVDYDQVD